jgi:hypothetical protein
MKEGVRAAGLEGHDKLEGESQLDNLLSIQQSNELEYEQSKARGKKRPSTNNLRFESSIIEGSDNGRESMNRGDPRQRPYQ